jgi:large subunit ribosomal protein L32
MANPKRRHSRQRRDKRRTNWKIKTNSLSVCPQCKSAKLPHRVCPTCGYYKGKEVVSVDIA